MLENWTSATHPSWAEFLKTQDELLRSIELKLRDISRNEVIIPSENLVLRALGTPLLEVRCLILGQDPYPNKNFACGLAFAVERENQTLPMSLRNIRKELLEDCGCIGTGSFNISNWQKEGVLLLNRVLTVSQGKPNSHKDLGWEEFTSNLIQYIDSKQKVVALLWGNSAHQIESSVSNMTIIKSAHPSPLSARKGFFGSRPFTKANLALQNLDLPAINWCSAFSTHE